jgi:protein-S-isoprenylcysteine O-methyltransferase Ste14
MAASSVAEAVQTGTRAYWRELLFSRLVPALFFSVFLARQLLFAWDGLHSVHKASDYLFVFQQLLSVAFFTMLVVLYTTRLPKRGTDHRWAVVLVAFTGTFAALATPFLPGGGRRESLVLFADIMATAGLAYTVWGLAYLRRSFSIMPEARRLVMGGPYSLSRHPVYLGEIVTVIGVNLATAGLPGSLAIALVIACQLLRMRWEEEVLGRTFPNDYPGYALRVPRYFPNPFRVRRGDA